MKCSRIQKPEAEQKEKGKETTRGFCSTMAGDSSPKIGKQSRRDLNEMGPSEWSSIAEWKPNPSCGSYPNPGLDS